MTQPALTAFTAPRRAALACALCALAALASAAAPQRLFFGFGTSKPGDPEAMRQRGADAVASVQARWERLGFEGRALTGFSGASAATRAAVTNALAELGARLGTNDTVVLYSHTHGVTGSFGRAGGLVLDGVGPESVLSWSDYADLLLALPARTVVVLMMACHSGSLTDHLNTDPKARSLLRARREQGRNVLVLTSQNAGSLSNPRPIEGEIVNPFTYAVRRALDGAADSSSDGRLTLGELAAYTRDEAKRHTRPGDAANDPDPQVAGSFDPEAVLATLAAAATPKPSAAVAERPKGLLYFASYQQRDNPAAASNPHLIGALFTIYWSSVETREGHFDWADLDRRLAPWTGAGKRVALRVMWSSSGSWPEPAAKRPTPQFVLDAGAVTVRSESSNTQVPLAWDPVYRRHAKRFLEEVARKFDGDPAVLFVDVTPGAETNPYRFRRINAAEPAFKERFLAAAASDGRRYSHDLWLATVKQGVDDAAAAFKTTPLLVTLNVGSLDGPEQARAIGDHCVGRGCYVGQNGLTGRSYDRDSPRKAAFDEWGKKTRLYFEMLDASGGGTGSLLEVMKAAERVGCDYLGVYAADVLRGTRGQPNYDPAYEEALAYGARALSGAATVEKGQTP